MDSLTPGGSVAAATTAPAAIQWRSRRTAVIAGVTAVVVLAAAGLLVWQAMRPGPDDVARQFFAAVRQRDVDKALSLVRTSDRPSGEEARFLTRDAIADGWRVTEVELDARFDEGDRTADVKAWVLMGEIVEEGTFRLVDTDDGWRMDDPFVTYTPDRSPLWYITVNDATVASETFDPWALQQPYQLFPGVYRFGRATSDLVHTTADRVTMLPGLYRRGDSPEIAATAKALPAVQQVVDAHIDDCAKRTTTTNSGCPFGIDLFDEELSLGDTYVTAIADVRWKVLRYPTVALKPHPLGHFVITADKQPGVVQLTATGLDWEGRRIPFTTQCAVTEVPLVAGLTTDGAMSVVPPRKRYGDAATPQTPERCLRLRT